MTRCPDTELPSICWASSRRTPPEDGAGPSLLQEGTDFAAEQLTDALAHDLERRGGCPQPGRQLRPLLACANQLFGRKEHMRLVRAQTAQLEGWRPYQ
jgi:hypothetical protein